MAPRHTRVQTVFQDPFASLDPRMKVGETVAEGPITHGLTTKSDARAYAALWFERLALIQSGSTGIHTSFRVAKDSASQLPEPSPCSLMFWCDEPVAL